MNRPTILIVDDEATIRDVVRRYLERERFLVLDAETASVADALLRAEAVDLLILDVMLPDIDGFTFAEARAASLPPTIMLTARGAESDRLEGFALGADDYIVKPFSPRELVARVKAVLKRALPTAPSTDKPLTVGALTIEPARHRVERDGAVVTLTAKEFDLLYTLVRHPQQVFTREQLLDLVWNHEYYVDASTVTVHIRRLREKLEHDPAHPLYIQTVWGVGYKFEPA
ncbi:MAG: response regulator transcription factor [Chloroflexota bacterium]|nr:response regulator transcription factor [Chloroflexota bacterium]